ncbi:hypothetical protein [Desulfotalea psychrophila]|nr:hypothetical protein [Desulfotalea psychrophila]
MKDKKADTTIISMLKNNKATGILLVIFVILPLAMSQYYLSSSLHRQQQELLDHEAKVLCQFFVGRCNAFPYHPIVVGYLIPPPQDNDTFKKFYPRQYNSALDQVYNNITLQDEDLSPKENPLLGKPLAFKESGKKIDNHLHIATYLPVYIEGSARGSLLGEINLNELLELFFNNSQISLKKKPPTDPDILYSPIKNTDFYLTKKQTRSNLQVMLTSPLLLIAVFLFIMMMLAGTLHRLQRNFVSRSQKKYLSLGRKAF